MSKRTTFTTISPLPPGVTRQGVLDFLHNHAEMIDLNPLVIERHPIPPPAHAPPEEAACTWWSMTDKISYMPGVKSDLTYTAAFQDRPDGLQTHCYAPMGTHIRERWSLGGTLPGEPKQPVELGLGAPSQGLYIREDVEVRCNFLMAGFVKKTILKAHGVLVEHLASRVKTASSAAAPSLGPGAGLSPGSAYRGGTTSTHSGSGARSSSTHDERRTSYYGSSGASTPQGQPGTAYHQQRPSHGRVQGFYGHQRAAASETGLENDSVHTRQLSGQYQQPHGLTGGWGAHQPYVHDPHKHYSQCPQLPPLGQLGNGQHGGQGGWPNEKQGQGPSGPVAELRGSETHVAELQ
ncbi:uncharacterized protein JN550_000750 [Neoarthrinium moseri]|uniref:uncharacterized protein n=1 Tax=Neoarthrinium moseri TaxID=1658444 RepID=UPI001FDCC401|nr:uncharacterized protein JN550_000750 [Neoarthrinium moseri]KAI1876678.1 hypothetical protein JN550_000750 [Neoarthrinium moseri]